MVKAVCASALALAFLGVFTTLAAPTSFPAGPETNHPLPDGLDKLYPADLPVGPPRRFNLTAPAPGNKWSDDVPATCRALSTEVPALLANKSTLDGQPYTVANVITIFYPEGQNPTLRQLAADIPPGAIVAGKDDLNQSVVNDADWTPESIRADGGYGYQDEVQTKLGGLPSFCRFGASIITSGSSQIWFEVWMPLPNTGAVNPNATECSQGPLSSNVTGIPPQPLLNNTAPVVPPVCPAPVTASAPLPSPLPSPTTGGATTPPSLGPAMDQAGKEKSFAMDSPPSSSPDLQHCEPAQPPSPQAAAQTWRPASRKNWKGRLVFSGNAGLRGNVPYAELKQTLTRYREAAAGTNSGHFSSGAGSLWAKGPGNTESLLDFGSRGPHVATVAAAEVVKKFYGVEDRVSSPQTSRRLGFGMYWKGCSTGGRQGFGEAQKYPHDYDGILAGSPAFDYSSLNAYQIYVNSLQANKMDPGYIAPSLYPLIHKAVLDACDAADGAKDGIVGNALTCKPDFTVGLLCNTTTTPPPPAPAPVDPAASNATAPATCLTLPQLQNLERIYKPYFLNGSYIHGPVLPSSEFGWAVTNGVTGTPFAAAPAYYQYWLEQRTDDPPAFDYYKEVTPELIQKGRATDPGSTDNFSPDLSRYFSRGSRIIHYHGLADQLIPAGKSIQYWRKAVAQMGRAEVNKHYRLFLVPGMLHCRFGDGAFNFGGASQFDQPGWRPLEFDTAHDMLLSLFDWSELGAGHAPYYQIGASYLRNSTTEAANPPSTPQDLRSYTNGVRVTRRLCPYPKSPVLLDQGWNSTPPDRSINATLADSTAGSATKAEDYKCVDDGSFNPKMSEADGENLTDLWLP